MKISILLGHVRNNSNTEIVTDQFAEHLKTQGAEVETISLKSLRLEHCSACWTCQDEHGKPGCPKTDDMHLIYRSVLESDCVIFASPIYSWYCTPILKSVMDRLVYGLNKYYGDVPGISLWAGKHLGIITTCGYDIEQGAGVFQEGVKRYAKHSQLSYAGMLAIQDCEGKERFSSPESKRQICAYADHILHLADQKG